MELREWLHDQGGIAHRADALRAGFSLAQLRREMRDPSTIVIRRAWLALAHAPTELLDAARAGGHVACVTLARRRGWWMPDEVDSRTHLRLDPRAGSPRMPDDWQGVVHWTRELAHSGHRLEDSPESALGHIAECVPRDLALVLWESAIRSERLSIDALRRIPWTTRAAAECAAEVNGLSDSGLETLLVTPLRRSGLGVRQQIVLAGRPVDLLIGERLVVQIDGFAFHSSPAQRSRDIAHDIELRLRGYTVLRFSYAQVVHERETVERAISRAIAARLHVAS
jgi:very-short-patch-repair endonuclease